MHKNNTIDTSMPSTSYRNASGKIRYTMTNDYMFRAILQKNKKVLRGLICSLLHMQPDEIETISIKNPIILGEAISAKTVVLDIHLQLNNHSFLNLEMQVVNEHNWTDRSLFYLCRTFGQLENGDDYSKLLPATHIGFLDFTLFPEYPEFNATYKLLNIKNHHLYSDKFALSVVNLNRTDLATDEDKTYGIDSWAKIFKATTWEELHMLAQNNDYVEDIMQTMYECNDDESIRLQCSLREAEDMFNKMNERLMKQQLAEIEQQAVEIGQQAAEIEQQAAEINQLTDENARLKALLAENNIKY